MQLLIDIANSKWLKVALALAALTSGVDDLLEAWFGIKDLFHLDVAHGVVFAALNGVLDPLAKLLEQSEHPLVTLAERKKPD